MACRVVFFTPKGVRSVHAPGVGEIRVSETVAVGGTTNAVVRDGESVVVYNGETSAVGVAHGTSPDGAATASTDATSAAFPVPTGSNSAPFMPATGAKISVKALS